MVGPRSRPPRSPSGCSERRAHRPCLRATGFASVPERIWRHGIDHLAERRGPIDRLLDFLPFERDLRVMKICVSAAPLVGLLGSVTGMLATFEALSSGSSGEQTMARIAFRTADRVEEGALQIHVLDARTHAVVWTGTGRSILRTVGRGVGLHRAEFAPVDEERDWQVDAKVRAILAELP